MSKNEIFLTEDGSHSILSNEFGVSYHSKHGAITETYHVFINAALRFKAVIQKEINILEIGLGTGLNAYVTLLEAQKRNLKINYTAVEAFPVKPEELALLNYVEQLDPEHPELFQHLHSCEWGQKINLSPHFSIQKVLRSFEEIDYQDQFDIIYFDAFAPNAQPELWTETIMKKMYQALKAQGILTTYCAKGVVKRRMKQVGFTVEALPGPPRKREMTRAIK